MDSYCRQPGPVFVHERDSEPWTGDGLPEQLTTRMISVRVINTRARRSLETSCVEPSFAPSWNERSRIHRRRSCHLHNAGPGCFAARVDRDA
jgi:hypothetical protein